MIYQVRFTKEAKKDIAKLTPKLKQKLQEITALCARITDNKKRGKINL